MLIPRHGGSSETGRDVINLVDYRVLMIYYYRPSYGVVETYLTC